MEDRAYQALLTLAERLGTTIEHLWAVLLKQAVVTGMTNVVMLAAITTVACYLTRIVRIKTTPREVLVSNPYDPEAVPRRTMRAAWDPTEEGLLGWIGTGIMWLVVATLWFHLLPDTLAGLFNPEYWALKQVLTALR